MEVANEGIKLLRERVDSLIIVPNEKLLEVLGKDMNLLSAFKHANDVLFGAVKGITDLILLDGLMNVDFADVKTVMAEMGMAMMGSSESTGDSRAAIAAEGAARCPLLEDADLQGAKGILVNITSGFDLTLGEFQEVGNIIREFADDDATIIVGSVFDPEFEGTLRVTVVATGLRSAAPKSVSRIVPEITTPRKQGEPDWRALERPTSARRAHDQSSRSEIMQAPESNEINHDYLDVPAFLRRQAD